MAGEVTLNVADGDQGVTLEFDDLGELAQLLNLAGVSKQCDTMQPEPVDDQPDMEPGDEVIDVEGPIDMGHQTDENAEYDYGANPTSRKGYVYDTDPYKYQGDGEMPTRYVPSKSGDNPLVREGKTFISYLKEIEASRRSRRRGRHITNRP
jgi:hypothetical protein